MEDYRDVNRAWWDERAAAHAAALQYERYVADPGFLSQVVRFDLPRLGAITGLAEHDSVPWEALPGKMERIGGEWRLADQPWRLPHSYTLQAVKRGR